MIAVQLIRLLQLVPSYTEIILSNETGEYFRRVWATNHGEVDKDDAIIHDLPEMEGKLVFVIT